MTKKQSLGQLGENIAASYLKKKGYKIIDRNVNKPWGEIDIVARAPDTVLVFVEVKTVTGPNPNITPEDQMTKRKIGRLKRAAEVYAGNAEDTITKKGWRIDLVAVVVEDKQALVKHYENI